MKQGEDGYKPRLLMNKLIKISTVVTIALCVVFLTYHLSSGERKVIRLFQSKKNLFTSLAAIIKEEKIPNGSYYIDGRWDEHPTKTPHAMSDLISKIGIETNISIGCDNNTCLISIQLLNMGGIKSAEYYLLYFDTNSNREALYRNDFESSRMKVKPLDNNWVLYMEYSNIGKWN